MKAIVYLFVAIMLVLAVWGAMVAFGVIKP